MFSRVMIFKTPPGGIQNASIQKADVVELRIAVARDGNVSVDMYFSS
jgi:hypothetical protein